MAIPSFTPQPHVLVHVAFETATDREVANRLWFFRHEAGEKPKATKRTKAERSVPEHRCERLFGFSFHTLLYYIDTLPNFVAMTSLLATASTANLAL